MRIRPEGAELLNTARVALATRIAPVVPSDRTECVARIERAMALGERKLARGLRVSASELAALDDARVLVRETILTELPEERRYDARLVAKAISIAAAQLRNGSAAEVGEAQRLAALLEVSVPSFRNANDIRCGLTSLNEVLAARIRAGAADPETPLHTATLAHLEAITQAALAESNPAYRRFGAPVLHLREPAARQATGPAARAIASIAAWGNVSHSFCMSTASFWQPAPLARRIDSWRHLGGAFGDAVSVSGTAAIATQADLFGFVAQRVSAIPSAPTVLVESAHQLHDLSVMVADASAALFALAFAPFRKVAGGKGRGYADG